jgi:hypothetical protein
MPFDLLHWQISPPDTFPKHSTWSQACVMVQTGLSCVSQGMHGLLAIYLYFLISILIYR